MNFNFGLVRAAKKPNIPLCLFITTLLGVWVVMVRHEADFAPHEVVEKSHETMEIEISTALPEWTRSHLTEKEQGFHSEKISPKGEEVLKEMEQRVQEEMQNYSFHPAVRARQARELTPQWGGRPVINLIVTTWRSGSCFTGDLLKSHPASFYHFEPLLDFGITRPKYGDTADSMMEKLYQFFSCNFTQMDPYFEVAKKYDYVFNRNRRLWPHCMESPDLCLNPEFVSRFCALFPFQAVKLTRLPLNRTEELLRNKILDVRVLLLVRDPRGTMQSRRHMQWCLPSPECAEAASLCADLVRDYYAAETLTRLFPGRVKVMRYEDLSLDVDNKAREVYDFFRLTFTSEVEEFLAAHTNGDKGGRLSTFRDSKAVPFHWRTDLSYPQIDAIQSKCRRAMDLFKYRLALSSDNLEAFDPVDAFTFPE